MIKTICWWIIAITLQKTFQLLPNFSLPEYRLCNMLKIVWYSRMYSKSICFNCPVVYQLSVMFQARCVIWMLNICSWWLLVQRDFYALQLLVSCWLQAMLGEGCLLTEQCRGMVRWLFIFWYSLNGLLNYWSHERLAQSLFRDCFVAF